MTSELKKATDDQLELMTSLLADQEPGSYVVIPVEHLPMQVRIAMRETMTSRGAAQPGHATARLLRTLNTLGYVHKAPEVPR